MASLQNLSKEVGLKRVKSTFSKIKDRSDRLKHLIAEKQDIKQSYKKWMTLYEEFFTHHDELCALLSEEERVTYLIDFYNEADIFIQNVKSYVENWTSTLTKSQASPCSSRRSSVKKQQMEQQDENQSEQLGDEDILQSDDEKSEHPIPEENRSHLPNRNTELKDRQTSLKSKNTSKDTTNRPADRSRHHSPVQRRSRKGSPLSRRSESSTITGYHSNSSRSSLNSIKAKEIELKAEAKALEKWHRIEAEKMKLRFQEEQLDLETKLEIAREQRKLLDDDYLAEKQWRRDVTKPTDDSTPIILENTGSYRNEESNSTIKEDKPLIVKDKNLIENTPNEYVLGSLIKNLKKPTLTLQPFDGDLLAYRRFVRQFNSLIIENTTTDEERLSFLDQYTKGEPNNIVRSYSSLKSNLALDRALQDLETRYGNSEIIASNCLKKLLNSPTVRADDPKGLDNFSILLNECLYAVKDVDRESILEYPENLRQILKKLPYFIHEKWRTIVEKDRSNKRDVKFQELVELVNAESRKSNDPIYGRVALKDEPKATDNKRKATTNFRGSFSTDKQTDSNRLEKSSQSQNQNDGKGQQLSNPQQSTTDNGGQRLCLFCKQQHSINSCKEFEALPYDERSQFIQDNRICYGCLRKGHMKRDCHQREYCQHCNDRHPTVLHMNSTPGERTEPKSGTVVSTRVETSEGVVTHTEAGGNQCTMAIVPVKVKIRNSSRCIYTYAFHDPGSSVCFCTTNVMRQICGQGKRRRITLETMGKPHTMFTYQVEGIQICGLNSEEVINLPSVYTKDIIPVTNQHVPTQADIDNWSHFDGIRIPEIDCEIGLLIGNNVPDAYSPLDIRTGPKGSPHAVRSRLGWLIWNLVRTDEIVNAVPIVNRVDVLMNEKIAQHNQLENLVKQSISLDFPERIIHDKKENSQLDKLFLQKVEGSLKFENGHYSMKLPFKDQNVQLPNNLNQAENRLKSLQRKMKLNPKFRGDYEAFMAKILDDGYAEMVPEDEIHKDNGRVWYLPHFGVYHAKKQDKIRVVFDCAAQYGGISLNDMLLQGPDMTNNLTGVLLRFRQSYHGVMGDINSMFFQCLVPKEDRDYLRFMWWPDGNLNQKPCIYRMAVHLFGATSSPSCANLALRRTAYDNITHFDETVIETVLKNFYVDDCLKSLDEEQELVKLVKDLCLLCRKGGFKISKWISSSRAVLDSIPDEDKAKGIKDLDLDIDTLPVERALGVNWSIESDTLEFKINLQQQPTTRRGMLSTVASVYDPLGLASPFVLPAKLILRTLCQKGFGWDDHISEMDEKHWNTWLNDLQKLEQLSVPRCYKKDITKDVVSCQLHSFSDASDIAYGVIIYLRLEDSDGNISCTPVIAKSRVAPIKKITIPRMELTAATVSVRLCNMVKTELELNVNETYYWTDSMTVLRYIRNQSTRFQTFVANRIEIIRDGTDITNWKYVDTKRNPADDASRSLSMAETEKVARWLNGPDFLNQPANAWPVETGMSSDIPLDDVELKKPVASTHVIHVIVNMSVQRPLITLDAVINHYSSWHRLKRALGWYILFIDYLKLKKDRNIVNRDDLHMKTSTLLQAETKIITFVQNSHFSEEIKALTERKTVKKTSSLLKLDPILFGNTLRVGGRLSRSNLPYNSKHQLILPKNSYVSKLILLDIHKRTGHLGKNTVISNARENYWILGASSLVKEITSKCVMCRKYRAKVNEQKMADLPFDRVVTGEAPFTRVGMDFFGPIEVKRGRSDVKVYGVIFTCLVVRAVHIEVAASLTTDSCINAMRRFIARRGPVKVIRSDNGTNLVGAEREMREEIQRWNEIQIKNELLQHGIDWEFNPPSGSHFGGVWERLIRSTRKILYSLLNERLIRLDYESLSTLLCEVEAVLNNRPLTVASSDKDDLEPLTPNHLLLFKHGENFPPGLFNENDNFASRKWRQIQYLTDIFWKRFAKEYLPLMQVRSKWNAPHRNVAVGDIVVVLDNTLRNSYVLGKVISVVSDKKGLVRIVNVKTKTTMLQRPVDKISVILESNA